MLKSQVDPATLVATALAATLAVTLLSGPFAWMGSIIGLVLLLILFSFDQEGYRTFFGSLAFSAVSGFCFAVACGALLSMMSAHGEIHLANGAWESEWLPFTFLFATAILWAIDRSRMTARAPVAERPAVYAGGIQGSFIRTAEPALSAPPTARTYPAPVYQPPAPPIPSFEPQQTYSQPPPPPPQPAAPQPAFSQQPTFTQQPAFSQQPSFTPAHTEPPPVNVAPPPAVAQHPQSMLTATTSEAVRPAPAPVIPRGGPEVMIYVSLLGEGLNVMRTVRAEHLGRDYYKIVETMPENENWQFQPGQVVRCKKQSLSTGKAMVAYEEAQRAQ